MIESIDFSEQETLSEESPRLIYVRKVGETNGVNIYQFLYSDNIDNVWMEQWNEKPACNCRFLEPEESMYQYVKEIKTEINFNLASQNCCCSFQDCCDDLIALCGENIDSYVEYPEPFRIVLHFGDTMDEVDKILSQRNIISTFVQK